MTDGDGAAGGGSSLAAEGAGSDRVQGAAAVAKRRSCVACPRSARYRHGKAMTASTAKTSYDFVT